MGPETLGALTGIIAVLVGGAIIMTPLLALSARFALKPLIETWAKARQQGNDASLQDRRIHLLEAEVQHLQNTVQQLKEAEEFRRQLAVPSSSGVPAAQVRAADPTPRA